MKHLIRIFTCVCLLSILLTSCEDNYVLENTSDTISEPIEVESTTITGIVTNNENEPIDNAEVSIRHDDIISSVYTNKIGAYSIQLPQDGSRMFLQVNADTYVRSSIKSIDLDQEDKKTNIRLLHDGELEYESMISAMASQSLATISGQVLLADGSPAVGTGIISIDLTTFTFSNYDYTDENGNYSFASTPFENYAIVAYNGCNGIELIAENVTFADEDLDFGTFQSQFTGIEQFIINGFITDCNTEEGLASGEVLITFDGNINSYRADIIDGEYSVLVDNCLSVDCYNINIMSDLHTDQFKLTCEPISGSMVNADYTFCSEVVVLEGTIKLQYGTETKEFNLASAELDDQGIWSIAGVSESFADNFIVITDGNNLGENGISILQLSLDNEPILQNYNGSGIPYTVEITEIDEYIKGNLYGDVITNNGTTISLTGTFDIKL